MVEPEEAQPDSAEVSADDLLLAGLLPALRRLDQLLARAVQAAQAAYGPAAAADPFRGLHIDQAEVDRLLARAPGAPALRPEGEEAGEPLPDPLNDGSRLAWLALAFGLDPFDLDLLLLALAPEIDRRYERLYAYLQDHVARRRPSVDLALHLLCPDAAARIAQRAHFDPAAPLIRQAIIHLIPESDQDYPALLAHTLKLDEQITRFLLYQDDLDPRLVPYCELVYGYTSLDDLPLPADLRHALPPAISAAIAEQRPLRLYFQGPVGSGRREAAAALAGECGCALLVVDLARAAAGDLAQTLRLALRYACLQDAVVYLDGLDALRRDDMPGVYRLLLEALAAYDGVVILAGAQLWAPAASPLGVVSVSFAMPDVAGRRACWRRSLEDAGVDVEDEALDTLAGRFRLLPGQIAEAVAGAISRTALRVADPSLDQPAEPAPDLAELFAAARAQSGQDLAALAQKIAPLYRWGDIVLPADTLAQLREICQWVEHRHTVLDAWGFAGKLALGKGVNTLFAGPSGTGKTMAAEIIANDLGLDLYKIDLAGVVSKYIGETEKNLDRIFGAAASANAILLFDEADALFGKRSEVRDSHDRYANIEISYLLQKIEEYDGVAILASNLRQNLDEAFVRRLAFTVHFPFPDEADRRRIWAQVWPAATPLAANLDLGWLACQFKLSGGNIKNIALAAAFLAAAEGSAVTMDHLCRAVQREYLKLGKALSAAELAPAGQGVPHE